MDAYLTTLRALAKNSNFAALESSLIRDRIVVWIRDNQTRSKLLQDSKLTLKGCIYFCRSYETTNHHMKAMIMSQEEVHLTEGRKSASSKSGEKQIRCKFCTRTHARNKLEWPAWGKPCSSCGKLNHFAVACPTKLRRPARRYVPQLEEDS